MMKSESIEVKYCPHCGKQKVEDVSNRKREMIKRMFHCLDCGFMFEA